MKCEIVPVTGKNPGINIYGKHVTPLVHEVFRLSMIANRIDDPWYRARTEANAFFQGGCHDPKGKWVFIEFWAPERTGNYLKMINEVLSMVDDEGCAKELTFRISDETEHKRLLDFLSFYTETDYKIDGDLVTVKPSHGGMLMGIHSLGLQPIQKETSATDHTRNFFRFCNRVMAYTGPVRLKAWFDLENQFNFSVVDKQSFATVDVTNNYLRVTLIKSPLDLGETAYALTSCLSDEAMTHWLDKFVDKLGEH